MATAATVADGETATPQGSLRVLALGALGVVYGDLGTSPLYTLKTALDWAGGATPAVAIGMLSLIIWTLLVTTSFKYVAVVMRADNDGEGGILALMSLLGIKHGERSRRHRDRSPRRRAALRRRRDHAGDFGPERARGTQVTGTRNRTLHRAAVGVGAGRLVRPSVAGQRTHRKAVRPDHDGLVRNDRPAWARRNREDIRACWWPSTRAMGSITCWGMDSRVFLFLAPCSCAPPAPRRSMPTWVTSEPRPIRFAWYGLVLPALVLNYAGQTAIVVDGAVADRD